MSPAPPVTDGLGKIGDSAVDMPPFAIRGMRVVPFKTPENVEQRR